MSSSNHVDAIVALYFLTFVRVFPTYVTCVREQRTDETQREGFEESTEPVEQ